MSNSPVTRRGLLGTAALGTLAGGALAGAARAQTAPSPTSGPGAAPMTVDIGLTVNGVRHELKVDPRTTLLDLLREQLGLTGTKKGCDGFQCGYCTPGQICSAVGMLAELKSGLPSAVTADLKAPAVDMHEDEVRERMSGNICRCAAYPNIVAAILDAGKA